MEKLNLVYDIDDDDLVRNCIDLLLTTEGFDIETYASAVNFLRAGPPCRDGLRHHGFSDARRLGIDLLP